MTALRALRLILPVLVVAALVGVADRLLGGGSPLVDVGPLRLRLGLVNLVLLGYIAALLWLLARYSSTNLRGQERLTRFGALFAGVALSLLVLVLAGDLLTIAVAWTTSGVSLGCLVSHAGTVNGRLAGRRVQRSMAISSTVMWVAVIVAGLSDLALDGTDPEPVLASGSATVVAVLLVWAGAVRSALAPFHRWLPETAEAPSPVSALLHAGIVNGTGVIAVLQWDLLSAQPLVLLGLTVIGLATVAWCSLEQRVRPDVKGRLAASTSAQMGWMALQVGLGAPAAALLHLMGHGAWKAWLFLRAGGAVVRARREPADGGVARRDTGATFALSLSPTLGLVTLAMLSGSDTVTSSPIHVLLLGMSLLVGVAVGLETSALERSSAGTRWAVAAGGGLTIAGYLAAAVVWEQQVAARTGLTGSVPAWGVPVATAGLVVVGLLAWGAVRLHVAGHHPVATLVSATSLPPGVRGTARASHRPVAEASRRAAASRTTDPAGTGDERADVAVVRRAVGTAGRLMGPAWPLRATVAVNPVSGLEVLPFHTALDLAERFHGTALRPSFDWFLDLYDAGQVTDEELAQAMDDHGIGGGPRGTAGLVDLTRQVVALRGSAGDGAEAPGDSERVAGGPRAMAHAHLWSARAWHRAEDRTADLHGPWHLWKRSAEHPVYRLATGSPDADRFARSLPEDPAEAIVDLLHRTGHPLTELVGVATGILAAGPGWVAHAQWRARRSGSAGPLVELVALRLALMVMHGEPVPARSVTRPAGDGAAPGSPLGFRVLQKVWLDALDLTTRELLCRPLAARQSGDDAPAPGTARTSDDTTPDSQSVWCIDVRSERLRRHLEGAGDHETFGFAGFFGIAGRVTHADGTSFDQCPVIVTPTVEIDVPSRRLGTLPAMTLAATRVAGRPGLGFAVAEASGAAALGASLAASLAPRTWRRVLDRSVRGRVEPDAVSLRDLADPGRLLSVQERADAAESMLRTIGLVAGFARVLVLAGHGSTTENNAYATAYDCGACGGNPGVLNASAMAQVLNDPAVRAELARRGISIPASTRVLAALHDTTTDQVTIEQASPADAAAADLLRPALDVASRRAAAERRPVLPTQGRGSTSPRATAGQSLAARATDWSEPMPEWGLAGCAAIVVGPRHLSRGIDLAGRTFLHSYDRHHDPDGSVLTAILNAPVVVSQWIAAQYWFSSVAPTVLGSGDKTTHNVVGDIGVLSGAHGDLRTGLPWQALFARDPGTRPDGGHDPQHVPARHLVVVDADPARLAGAVRRSPTIQTLLAHEWMRMVALDRGRIVDVRSYLADESDRVGTASDGRVDHGEVDHGEGRPLS